MNPAVTAAIQALQAGAVDRARTLVDDAVARDFRDADAAHLAGRLAIGADTARAVGLLERAVMLAPRRAMFRNDLAAAYRLANRPQEAAAVLESTVLLAANDPDVWHNLGMTRRALGDLAGAARALERALIFADKPATWGALGMVRDALNDGPGAIAAFRRMTELAPDAVEAQVNLAVALARADDFDGAYRAASRAVAIDSAHVMARLNMGLFARHLGRVDEARGAFAWVLARDPANATARAELAALDAAR